MSLHTRGAGPHAHGPLEDVLRAVTVPGHPEELVGEREAVAAFRAAAADPRERSLLPRGRPLLARVRTVKALVVGAVAVTTGVVLAAAAGALPAIWQEPARVPPAEPPAVNRTTEPTVPPPAVGDNEGPPTSEEPRSEPRPTSPTLPSCEAGCPGDGAEEEGPATPPNREEDGDDRDHGENHEDEDPEYHGPFPTKVPHTPPLSPTETPDSPAPGAVTAVPPHGAEPPTQGG